MMTNTNLSFEQNTINVPKEVQFYVQNQDGLFMQTQQPILVSKEVKEMVEKSGLFKEEDRSRFISQR